MKDKIILVMKRWFHYIGFTMERIPDEHKLFDELSMFDQSVQHHVLKKLTHNIRIGNNHKLYNNLLKKYVPDWDMTFDQAEFIGQGRGEFSFDTFRKVYKDDRCLFEKIYFTDTYDLLKLEWFYEYVDPVFKLSEVVKTTTIHEIIRGEQLTIVYFEFTELVSLSDTDFNINSFDISRYLFELSKDSYIESLIEGAPSIIKNYEHHSCYKQHIKTASKIMNDLSNNECNLKVIKQVVDKQSLVLTHGDIKENIFENNYLLDWDSFGFFPIGFESAFILYKIRNILSLEDLQRLLLENYKTVVDEEQWEGFELSCLYFYFIFIALNEKTPFNLALQKDVFKRVQQLYSCMTNS